MVRAVKASPGILQRLRRGLNLAPNASERREFRKRIREVRLALRRTRPKSRARD